jgi:phosphatidylglycerol lysyltransferase
VTVETLPNAIAHVRDLVLRYGWNSTAYQILNPGISHWLTADGSAVVGHVRRRRVWLAAGAPVCAAASLEAVARQFEAEAASCGNGVCYFGAAARLEAALRGAEDHASIAIGAQPVWDPHHWEQIIARRRSLRAQLNRARNKGVSIARWPAEQGGADGSLRRCLAQWLAARPLPPMRFLVEPDTLDGVLLDRLLFVALREGGPVGFLLASPVPQRHGYLVEQVIRCQDAPNGTAELLIDAAMRYLAGLGCDYATLGLVALAEHARCEMAENPWWLRALLNWGRAHGRRFYNFEGLEAFRTKMEPDDWEPIYAISNERHFSPMTLHAVAAAFCDGSPAASLGQALWKAMRQESRWLMGK